MKLASLSLYRYDLPLSEPVRLKQTTLRNREGLLVELAAPRVDVRALFDGRRGIERRLLRRVA